MLAAFASVPATTGPSQGYFLDVRSVPARLVEGWQIALSEDASRGASRRDFRRLAGSVTAEIQEMPLERARLAIAIRLPEEVVSRALAIEFPELVPGDEVFFDGAYLKPSVGLPTFGSAAGVPGTAGRAPDLLFELPPALLTPGKHVLLVTLSPRRSGRSSIWEAAPVLDSLSAAVKRRLLRFLPRFTWATITAAFGVFAALLFLRNRTRADLPAFALWALGVAVSTLAPLLTGLLSARVEGAMAFATPLAGYVFLLLFLRLPVTTTRRVLLAVPSLGLLAVLLSREIPRSLVDTLAATSLLALSADLLLALSRPSRRRKPETALVFAGIALLLLAVLVDTAVERHVLLGSGGDLTLVGPVFLVFTAILLLVVADEDRRLLVRATTDPLTNLLNRGAFLARSSRELQRAERTGRPLGLAMLDLDHFKSVNDRFGHQTGDKVLAEAARVVAETTRGIDLAGRYGGEEFIVLFVEADEDAAFAAVERIREAVSRLAPPTVPEPLTFSAGLAVHNGLFDRATIADLIRRADAALYESKRRGRNRTTVDQPDAGPPRSAAELRYR